MLSPKERDEVVKDVMKRFSREDINYINKIANKCVNPRQFSDIFWRAQQEMARKASNEKQGFEPGE